MTVKDPKFLYEMYSHQGSGEIMPPRFNKGRMGIVEILKGNVNLRIGTELVVAKAGDFLYIPANTVFSAEAVEKDGALRGICFDKKIIEANMENYEEELLYMFYVQSENNIAVFDKAHPTYAILLRCMNEAYEENLSKDVCYKLPIRANIYLMMSALLRYYCGSKNDLDKLVYHNVLRLKPVIDYISANYAEKLYIEKLSEKIVVSADYFTKMFKDSIGKTPVDYINGKRVERALELLICTEKSMADIAAMVGFSNANYFHKIFKQYMDMSPLAYRKKRKA
jgi:YesN/AraC family two-component response regulator